MVLAGGLMACSSAPVAQSQSAPETEVRIHRVSGLDVVPLTIMAADGRQHRFRVELAASEAAQARGLMFRTEMGPDEGMLFPSTPIAERSFWMKNTVIPLDIIFIGPDRRITNIEAGVPYELRPVASTGATSAVLELIAGRSAALGIKPGDRVVW